MFIHETSVPEDVMVFRVLSMAVDTVSTTICPNHLKSVHFTQKSRSLPDSFFDNLVNLQDLNLDNNQLTDLPDSFFDNIVNVET